MQTRIEYQDADAQSELVWNDVGKLLGSVWTEDRTIWFSRKVNEIAGYWSPETIEHIDRNRALLELNA